MNFLAGALFYARAIPSAILEWARAGGGAAGWEAARDVLTGRFPQASTVSMNAVINRAKETVQTGAAYQRANDDYAPDLSQLPDVRAAERRAGIGPPEGTSGEEARQVYHTVEIKIIDPNSDDFAQQFTQIITTDNNPLQRGVLEQLAQEAADRYLANFLNYDPDRLEKYGFETMITIRGAYIGY